jgi:alpha-beta hydrolase superfamily lysophospholipase
MPYEDVTVTNRHGLQLVGWYVPPRNGAVIMVQHGGFEDRPTALPEAKLLYERGYGVLFTTIEAHDLSEGEVLGPSADAWQDIDAWCRFLLTREDLDRDRIGIFAKSYGGLLAIQCAARNQAVKAVAVDCAIASLKDLIEVTSTAFTGLPPFPFAPMVQFWVERAIGFRFEDVTAIDWIGRISPRPVLLMQGGRDELIPVNSGQRLYDAAGEPKELWFEAEVRHNEFAERMPQAFQERIAGFFDRCLLGA